MLAENPVWDALDQKYWSHFGAPSSLAEHVNSVVVAVVLTLSLVLNGGTLVVYLKHPQLNIQLRPYVIGLCISCISSPLATYWMNVASSVQKQWLFGESGCTFYGVVQGYCAFVSVTTVSIVGIERWQSLRRADQFKLSPRCLLFVVWTYPLFASLPPVFGWSQYTLSGFMTSCSFDFVHTDWPTRTYVLFISIYGFVIPVLVTLVSYSIVGHEIHLRSHSLTARNSVPQATLSLYVPQRHGSIAPSEGVRSNERHRTRWQRQIKPLRVMGIVGSAFVIAWTPYAIAAYVAQFGPKYIISPLVITVLNLLAKSSTTFNPVIYVCTDTAFRRCTWKTIKELWKKWTPLSARRQTQEL